MAIVPSSWMPNCSMKRVITHWTAGGHKASDIDKAHYHILVESDGNLVRGTHSIKDNVSTGDNVYAAHVALFNTGSIGVSICCMAGAKEKPFNAGNFPMTKKQWETMAQVVAELCDFYEIEVTEKTVLGHAEVPLFFPNKPQPGKWDPLVLPWDTSLTKSQVGEQFRSLVKAKMTGQSSMQESPASITAVVVGRIFREAQIFNEKSIIKIRPLIDVFDGVIFHANIEGIIELNLSGIADQSFSISCLLIDHDNQFLDLSEIGNKANKGEDIEADMITLVNKFGFVKATDLASALNIPVSWDGQSRTVTLG